MMTFWLLLAGMMMIALACVIVPLWCGPDSRPGIRALAIAVHRSGIDELEQDCAAGLLTAGHRAEAQREIERRLVDEAGDSAALGTNQSQLPRNMLRAGVAAILVALLPTAALVLYMRIGDPVAAAIDGIDGTQVDAHMDSQGSLEFVVSGLAKRLRAQPNDAAGWAMLARSYAVLERTEDAVAAYRRAIALSPTDPGLLADYADELATLRGGDLNGDAMQSIEAALAIDPNNAKALALAGSAAFDRHDYRQAEAYWMRLKAVASPEVAAQAQHNVEMIEGLIAKSRGEQGR